MRPAIQRNDAHAVNLLVENRDIAGRLKQLNIIVVATRVDGRTGFAVMDAPGPWREVLP